MEGSNFSWPVAHSLFVPVAKLSRKEEWESFEEEVDSLFDRIGSLSQGDCLALRGAAERWLVEYSCDESAHQVEPRASVAELSAVTAVLEGVESCRLRCIDEGNTFSEIFEKANVEETRWKRLFFALNDCDDEETKAGLLCAVLRFSVRVRQPQPIKGEIEDGAPTTKTGSSVYSPSFAGKKGGEKERVYGKERLSAALTGLLWRSWLWNCCGETLRRVGANTVVRLSQREKTGIESSEITSEEEHVIADDSMKMAEDLLSALAEALLDLSSLERSLLMRVLTADDCRELENAVVSLRSVALSLAFNVHKERYSTTEKKEKTGQKQPSEGRGVALPREREGQEREGEGREEKSNETESLCDSLFQMLALLFTSCNVFLRSETGKRRQTLQCHSDKNKERCEKSVQIANDLVSSLFVSLEDRTKQRAEKPEKSRTIVEEEDKNSDRRSSLELSMEACRGWRAVKADPRCRWLLLRRENRKTQRETREECRTEAIAPTKAFESSLFQSNDASSLLRRMEASYFFPAPFEDDTDYSYVRRLLQAQPTERRGQEEKKKGRSTSSAEDRYREAVSLVRSPGEDFTKVERDTECSSLISSYERGFTVAVRGASYVFPTSLCSLFHVVEALRSSASRSLRTAGFWEKNEDERERESVQQSSTAASAFCPAEQSEKQKQTSRRRKVEETENVPQKRQRVAQTDESEMLLRPPPLSVNLSPSAEERGPLFPFSFPFHVSSNLYLTPPSSRGFELHCDDHDVVVLGLKGKKRWTIDAEDEPFPLPSKGSERRVNNGDSKFIELIVEEGDVLFLRRGVGHAAAALSSNAEEEKEEEEVEHKVQKEENALRRSSSSQPLCSLPFGSAHVSIGLYTALKDTFVGLSSCIFGVLLGHYLRENFADAFAQRQVCGRSRRESDLLASLSCAFLSVYNNSQKARCGVFESGIAGVPDSRRGRCCILADLLKDAGNAWKNKWAKPVVEKKQSIEESKRDGFRKPEPVSSNRKRRRVEQQSSERERGNRSESDKRSQQNTALLDEFYDMIVAESLDLTSGISEDVSLAVREFFRDSFFTLSPSPPPPALLKFQKTLSNEASSKEEKEENKAERERRNEVNSQDWPTILRRAIDQVFQIIINESTTSAAPRSLDLLHTPILSAASPALSFTLSPSPPLSPSFFLSATPSPTLQGATGGNSGASSLSPLPPTICHAGTSPSPKALSISRNTSAARPRLPSPKPKDTLAPEFVRVLELEYDRRATAIFSNLKRIVRLEEALKDLGTCLNEIEDLC